MFRCAIILTHNKACAFHIHPSIHSINRLSVTFAAICNPVLGIPVAYEQRSDIRLGPCVWVIDRMCPDSDVKFYLFSRSNPKDRQLVYVDSTWDKSNVSQSAFDPALPTKIIIHGYNSDMFLTPLIDMKDGTYICICLELSLVQVRVQVLLPSGSEEMHFCRNHSYETDRALLRFA